MQKEPAGQLVVMAVSSQQSLTTLKASHQGDMRIDSSLSSVLNKQLNLNHGVDQNATEDIFNNLSRK